MPHHYFHLFAHKYQLLGKFGADVLSVDVAVYAPDYGLTVPGLTIIRGEPMRKFNRSKISRMPYFITVFEMSENRFIEIAMCIRYQSNSFQSIN